MNILFILAIFFFLIAYTGMRMFDTNGNKNEALVAVIVMCVGAFGLLACAVIGGIWLLMESLPFGSVHWAE